jgi:hypothetical protein
VGAGGGAGFETGCGAGLIAGGDEGGAGTVVGVEEGGVFEGGVVLPGGGVGGGAGGETGGGGLGLPPEESLCPLLPKSVVHQITCGSL